VSPFNVNLSADFASTISPLRSAAILLLTAAEFHFLVLACTVKPLPLTKTKSPTQ